MVCCWMGRGVSRILISLVIWSKTASNVEGSSSSNKLKNSSSDAPLVIFSSNEESLGSNSTTATSLVFLQTLDNNVTTASDVNAPFDFGLDDVLRLFYLFGEADGAETSGSNSTSVVGAVAQNSTNRNRNGKKIEKVDKLFSDIGVPEKNNGTVTQPNESHSVSHLQSSFPSNVSLKAFTSNVSLKEKVSALKSYSNYSDTAGEDNSGGVDSAYNNSEENGAIPAVKEIRIARNDSLHSKNAMGIAAAGIISDEISEADGSVYMNKTVEIRREDEHVENNSRRGDVVPEKEAGIFLTELSEYLDDSEGNSVTEVYSYFNSSDRSVPKQAEVFHQSAGVTQLNKKTNYTYGTYSSSISWLEIFLDKYRGTSWIAINCSLMVLSLLIGLFALYRLLGLPWCSLLLSRSLYLIIHLLVFTSSAFRVVHFLHLCFGSQEGLPLLLTLILTHTPSPCLASALALMIHSVLSAARVPLIRTFLPSVKSSGAFCACILAVSFVGDVATGISHNSETLLVFRFLTTVTCLFSILMFTFNYRRVIHVGLLLHREFHSELKLLVIPVSGPSREEHQDYKQLLKELLIPWAKLVLFASLSGMFMVLCSFCISIFFTVSYVSLWLFWCFHSISFMLEICVIIFLTLAAFITLSHSAENRVYRYFVPAHSPAQVTQNNLIKHGNFIYQRVSHSNCAQANVRACTSQTPAENKELPTCNQNNSPVIELATPPPRSRVTLRRSATFNCGTQTKYYYPSHMFNSEMYPVVPEHSVITSTSMVISSCPPKAMFLEGHCGQYGSEETNVPLEFRSFGYRPSWRNQERFPYESLHRPHRCGRAKSLPSGSPKMRHIQGIEQKVDLIRTSGQAYSPNVHIPVSSQNDCRQSTNDQANQSHCNYVPSPEVILRTSRFSPFLAPYTPQPVIHRISYSPEVYSVTEGQPYTHKSSDSGIPDIISVTEVQRSTLQPLCAGGRDMKSEPCYGELFRNSFHINESCNEQADSSSECGDGNVNRYSGTGRKITHKDDFDGLQCTGEDAQNFSHTYRSYYTAPDSPRSRFFGNSDDGGKFRPRGLETPTESAGNCTWQYDTDASSYFEADSSTYTGRSKNISLEGQHEDRNDSTESPQRTLSNEKSDCNHSHVWETSSMLGEDTPEMLKTHISDPFQAASVGNGCETLSPPLASSDTSLDSNGLNPVEQTDKSNNTHSNSRSVEVLNKSCNENERKDDDNDDISLSSIKRQSLKRNHSTAGCFDSDKRKSAYAAFLNGTSFKSNKELKNSQSDLKYPWYGTWGGRRKSKKHINSLIENRAKDEGFGIGNSLRRLSTSKGSLSSLYGRIKTKKPKNGRENAPASIIPDSETSSVAETASTDQNTDFLDRQKEEEEEEFLPKLDEESDWTLELLKSSRLLADFYALREAENEGSADDKGEGGSEISFVVNVAEQTQNGSEIRCTDCTSVYSEHTTEVPRHLDTAVNLS